VHVASQLTNYIPKIQTLHELRKGESEHSTHTHTHTHMFFQILPNPLKRFDLQKPKVLRITPK
jgi:hypothetical protein